MVIVFPAASSVIGQRPAIDVLAADRFRDAGGAVPQRAHHHRRARIAGDQQHQHLLIDIGNQEGAEIVTGERHGHARPDRRVVVGIGPQQLHLDTRQALRVLDRHDLGEVRAGPPSHRCSERELRHHGPFPR
jgi:hypothetical protein